MRLVSVLALCARVAASKQRGDCLRKCRLKGGFFVGRSIRLFGRIGVLLNGGKREKRPLLVGKKIRGINEMLLGSD